MDSGDTAWVLTSAALVLLMTRGLVVLRGNGPREERPEHDDELRRARAHQCAWVTYGYSMAFGNDVGGGLLGDPTEFFGLAGLIGTERVDNGLAATTSVTMVTGDGSASWRGHGGPRGQESAVPGGYP